VSEFEREDRLEREPTIEDLRQLMGASTPHFALHLRNRIRNLIAPLPIDNPIRREGEREIARLDRLAVDGEHRGTQSEGLAEMPSLRREPAPGN
jgi:hypothetical protein